MTTTTTTQWRPPRKRHVNRRNPVKISRDELESAIADYLKAGGEVIRIHASDDQRDISEYMTDPMDLLEQYNGSL